MRHYLLWSYKLILLGLSTLVLTRDSIFRKPGIGVDPSWNIGINLALVNNFTFGKDIIFNYGPLGYLHTRLAVGVTKTEYLLWDAGFLILFIFILFYVYKHLNSFLAASMAFAAILIFSRSSVTVETLFLPFLFLLFHHLRHGSLTTLALASALSLILFYAKINVGLAAVVLVVVYLTYQYLFPVRHSRRLTLGYGVLFLATILLSAKLLNTYLPGYVWGGLQLIDSYNDAMFIYVKSNPYALPATILALGSIIPFGVILVLNLNYLRVNEDALLRSLYVSIYIFILFKQSFVRADWHILNFFQSIPLAIGLLAFFSTKLLSKQLAGVMAVAMVLSLPYATGLYDVKEFSATATTVPAQEFLSGTVAHINKKYQGFSTYLALAFDRESDLTSLTISELKLPERFLQKIGKQSVDVVPWEISYIYENHLTYNPRPIFQSYQANNDYLDIQNRDKYLSDNAPEYILFKVDSIDNQHPSFIESRTRLAMLMCYQYVDHEDDLVLLQKRTEPLDFVEFPPAAGYSQLGQDIRIEQTDDLLMMSFDIQYSLVGQLKRTFYQPPPLDVTLKFKDGDEKKYKAVKSVVNGEVLVNRFISRTEEAISFFKDPENSEKEVVAIRFSSPEDWGFASEFAYSIKRVKLGANRSAPN